MNTFTTICLLFAMAAVASANLSQQQHDAIKNDLTARHNDALAARVNLGTAISLVVPIALGVAFVAFLAPLFTSLFTPIPFGPTLGYARKGKSLFSGFNQENMLQILDTVTKAVEAFGDENKAQPKSK